MSKVIVQKNDHLKGSIGLESIRDFFMLIYLCAISGNQTNEGFDFIFTSCSFVLFVGMSILIQINNRKFRINSMLIWFCLFFGYACLSVAWAPSVYNVLALNTTFLQLIFIIFCMTNMIETNEDIDRILKYIIFSLVYASILLVIKTPSDVWGTERIGEVIGMHSNDLGLRLALGVILSMYFAFEKKKYGYLTFTIAFFILTMYSGSRKGFMMAVIGTALYYISSKNKQQTRTDLLIKFLKIIVIVLVFIAIYYIVMNNEKFYSVIGFRLESMFSDFSGEGSDASISEREFFGRRAWRLFLDNPVIGYGHNCFSIYLNSIHYGFLSYSHNNYLEILSALGLVGFSIYYSLMISILINLLNLWFKKIKEKSLLYILSLIFVLISFISWWQVSYYNKFIMVFYAVFYMFIKLNKNDINPIIKSKDNKYA